MANSQQITDLIEELVKEADMTLDEAFDKIAARILKGLVQTDVFKKLERIADEQP